MKISCLVLIVLALACGACNRSPVPFKGLSPALADQPMTGFYSAGANEYQVHFRAKIVTGFQSLDELSPLSDESKTGFVMPEINMALPYLFGPMTHRELGGMKPDHQISVLWSTAVVNSQGNVEVSFDYTGTWILKSELKSSFQIPFPLNPQNLFTDNWKSCSDSDPSEQTESFFWYFWDPARSGCDHTWGVQYQNITIDLKNPTSNQKVSRPEYDQLINSAGLKNNLSMTFAFGYIVEVAKPNPFLDLDMGMVQYRKFLQIVRSLQSELNWVETPILDDNYVDTNHTGNQIGIRFEGHKGAVKVVLKAVTNAGVDQMDLFAQSFAHDHDGYFGWFGHSRVGSGFDADHFKVKVWTHPEYYSMVKDYQLIYWSGCNSYSYYTMPFFKYKAELNPQLDPNGTKGLDILADGLPTYFALNSGNAQVMLDALVHWEKKTTYQMIVDSLEKRAKDFGTSVLINILGDEDNQ